MDPQMDPRMDTQMDWIEHDLAYMNDGAFFTKYEERVMSLYHADDDEAYDFILELIELDHIDLALRFVDECCDGRIPPGYADDILTIVDEYPITPTVVDLKRRANECRSILYQYWP